MSSSIFEQLGFSSEEALSQLQEDIEEARRLQESRNRYKDRDRRICACGHPIARHAEILTRGRSECFPFWPHRQKCVCRWPKAALKVTDTRWFNKHTDGPNAEHALHRGITKLKQSGGEVEWLVSTCDRCKESKEVVIASVSERGRAVYNESMYNAPLCVQCLGEL